jgi:hypothetical protein
MDIGRSGYIQKYGGLCETSAFSARIIDSCENQLAFERVLMRIALSKATM